MAFPVDLLTELAGIDLRLRDLALAESLERGPLEERRQAIRREIPAMLLAMYDTRERAGRRPPIVAVLDGTCSGCNLHIPAQLANDVRFGADIRSCPHCRRLLFARERTRLL